MTDANGDPVEAVLVRLLQLQFTENRRQMNPVPGVASRVTNDEGSYRFFGVPPGDYIVMAAITGATQSSPNPTLSPDPLTGRAQISLILPWLRFDVPTRYAARFSGAVRESCVIATDRRHGFFARARKCCARVRRRRWFFGRSTRRCDLVERKSPSWYAGRGITRIYQLAGRAFRDWYLFRPVSGLSRSRAVCRRPSLRLSSSRSTEPTSPTCVCRPRPVHGLRGASYSRTIPPPTGPELSSLRAAAFPVDFDLSQGTSQSARSDGTFVIQGLHGPRRLGLYARRRHGTSRQSASTAAMSLMLACRSDASRTR